MRVLFFLIALIPILALSQRKLNWKVLRFEVKEEWSETFQANMNVPVLTDQHLALEGQKVEIKGYLTCFDFGGGDADFMLSASDEILNGCTIGPGVDEVVDLKNVQLKPFKGIKEVQVTGVLHVNKDDTFALVYQLSVSQLMEKD